MEQERREVVNLREALRLRQECLDVQQWKQQRQRVRREGMGSGVGGDEGGCLVGDRWWGCVVDSVIEVEDTNGGNILCTFQ